MNGISVLIKETPECNLTLTIMWGTSKKTAIIECFTADTESTGTLILHFLASRIIRNKFLLWIKPLSLWCSVIAARIEINTHIAFTATCWHAPRSRIFESLMCMFPDKLHKVTLLPYFSSYIVSDLFMVYLSAILYIWWCFSLVTLLFKSIVLKC